MNGEDKVFAVIGIVIVLAVLALIGVGIWAIVELVLWVTSFGG